MLLSLGLLQKPLLERLLVKSSLGLVLVRGVLPLLFPLAGVILVGGVLAFLGAVGDEVVWVTTPKASLVQATTSAIQVIVVKSREPTDD